MTMYELKELTNYKFLLEHLASLLLSQISLLITNYYFFKQEHSTTKQPNLSLSWTGQNTIKNFKGNIWHIW